MRIRPFPLTQQELRELLDYDPVTGFFRWKTISAKAAFLKVGDRAGCSHGKAGYRVLCIAGSYWKEHRVAWFWVHGVWPPEVIDHINHDTADNRIANLRPASISENRQNMAKYRNNKSGFKGVHWFKGVGKWQAQIRHECRRYHLGFFDKVEDAAAAYAQAAARFHKFNPDAAA